MAEVPFFLRGEDDERDVGRSRGHEEVFKKKVFSSSSAKKKKKKKKKTVPYSSLTLPRTLDV